MFNFLSGGRARTSNRIRAQRARNATKRHLHLDNLETRALLTTIVNTPTPIVPHVSTVGSATISGIVEDDFNVVGFNNWEVDLLQSNSNGQPVAVTNTNPDGTFNFTGVKPGVYELQLNTPAGFAQDLVKNDSIGTLSTNGAAPVAKWGGKISQIGTTSTDLTYIVVSPTGTETYSGILFSFVPNGSVEGTVYNDQNDNQVLDTNPDGTLEKGIPNATVTLTGNDLNGHYVKLTTTTTGSLGTYDFQVAPSSPSGYKLTVAIPNGGFLSDPKAATVGSSGGTANQNGLVISGIVVTPVVEETGYNFGFIKPDSIQGYVFNDTTDTGILFQPQETPPGTLQPGIPGITVLLTGVDDLGHHVAATDTTDANGLYDFEGLRPGVYRVTELNTGLVGTGWYAEASFAGTFEPQYGAFQGQTLTIGTPGPASTIALIDITGITDTEGYDYDFLNLPL